MAIFLYKVQATELGNRLSDWEVWAWSGKSYKMISESIRGQSSMFEQNINYLIMKKGTILQSLGSHSLHNLDFVFRKGKWQEGNESHFLNKCQCMPGWL